MFFLPSDALVDAPLVKQWQTERVITRVLGEEEVGLSQEHLEEGFWYMRTHTDGTTRVVFFDPQVLIKRGVSEEEVLRIRNSVIGARILDKHRITRLDLEDMDPAMATHHRLGEMVSERSFSDRRTYLAEKKTRSKEEWQELIYLTSISGDYTQRDLYLREMCSVHPELCDTFEFTATGVVLDQSGNRIAGARVSVVGNEHYRTHTNELGVYQLTLPVFPFEKIRLEAQQEGYSHGFADHSVLGPELRRYQLADIVLASPQRVYRADSVKRTISGDGRVIGDSFIINTRETTYRIPFDVLVTQAGEPYQGSFQARVFEFGESDVPQSFINGDIFVAEAGLAGSGMVTYGMPYIDFADPEGNTLHVEHSRPMHITYRAGEDYRSAFTLEELKLLVGLSQTAPHRTYPLDDQLFESYDITAPLWWVLDRSTGVWHNEAMRWVDDSITLESIFYTRRD